MKEIIATGKNIDKAIENGLAELNAKFEDVDIEVISEGGLFSKAKVKISIQTQEDKNLPEPPPIKIKKEIKEETNDGLIISLKADNKENKVVKTKEPEVKLKKAEKDAPKLSSNDVVNFIEQLLKLSEINTKVSFEEDEENINVNIEGDSLSGVIGNKGETLSAIQYLASLIANKMENRKRVFVDAGSYKKSKEEKVKEITLKLIEKVKTSGRYEKMKPMNSYERRVAHSIINEDSAVYGESRGEDPNRYLTIFLKKD